MLAFSATISITILLLFVGIEAVDENEGRPPRLPHRNLARATVFSCRQAGISGPCRRKSTFARELSGDTRQRSGPRTSGADTEMSRCIDER